MQQQGNNSDDKLFHSNGFARVAQGSSMGAGTHETFSQRARVDRDRQVVNKYHESRLMQQHVQRDAPVTHVANPKPFGLRTDAARSRSTYAGRRMDSQQQLPGRDGTQQGAPARPQARFVEPQARYNPYA